MLTKFPAILILYQKCALASNYDFVIPLSLQPDGVDLWYFRLGLIVQGELKI